MSKQLCSNCDAPTGRCAEDAIRGENGAVLCEQCRESMWWCDNCGVHVDGRNVTYEETHDSRAGGCGLPVYANTDSAVPVSKKAGHDDWLHDYKLPCDVLLPPGTKILAGCSLRTLVTALDNRRYAINTAPDSTELEKLRRFLRPNAELSRVAAGEPKHE